MEAGETFPYIVNLTPKGAACVIESLAAKCADETIKRQKETEA